MFHLGKYEKSGMDLFGGKGILPSNHFTCFPFSSGTCPGGKGNFHCLRKKLNMLGVNGQHDKCWCKRQSALSPAICFTRCQYLQAIKATQHGRAYLSFSFDFQIIQHFIGSWHLLLSCLWVCFFTITVICSIQSRGRGNNKNCIFHIYWNTSASNEHE